MAREVYENVFDIQFSVPSRDIKFKPYSITYFKKKCDYFNEFIPIYELKCKISERYVNFLRIFDKELNANIRNICFYGENRESLNNRRIVFEHDFACYYDKNKIPSYMKASKLPSKELDEKDSYMPNAMGQDEPHEIVMYLFLKDDLKMKTFIHNYIFGSEENPATPISVVMTIVDQNPYIKKCLVDPPDNKAAYTDLIVEAAELKDAIKNIQYKYGIYLKGLELFYDDGVLYILNKLEPFHSYRDKELTTVMIRLNERTDVPANRDYALIDEENGIIGYERSGQLIKEDYEAVSGIFSGNKFVFSNFGTIINSAFSGDDGTTFVSPLESIERPRASRPDVGVKKILDYDMLNNPYNMSSYVFEESQGVPISFAIMNMNPEHFTPNKNFRMVFDTPESNKLYGGIYNISAIEIEYRTTNHPTKRYNTIASAVVTLCNKQEGYDKDYDPDDAKK